MRWILALLFTALSLCASTQKFKPVTTTTLGDGTMLVKVALNYGDINENVQRIRGIDGIHSVNFPLPEEWEIISAKGYLKYASSILMLKEHSAGLILFNDALIEQFKVFDYTATGVKFTIAPELFIDHNVFKVEMIQHYTHECEDGSSSELWTDIDLKQSYLEFHVRLKPMPEEIRSIKSVVFDEKKYSVAPLNYVIDADPSDEELRRYALFSAVAATQLKYRLEPISASNTIARNTHNVLITTKAKALSKLSSLAPDYIFHDAPLLSLHFNNSACVPWLNLNGNVEINATPEGVAFVTKDAFQTQSLKLSGGKIDLNNLALENTDTVTVAFWMQPERADKAILFGFDDYNLLLFDGHIGFNTGNKDLYGVKAPLSNGWHHVIATFNRHAIERNTLYIDGKAVALRQISGLSDSGAARISNEATIGGWRKNGAFRYEGKLDQFFLYDHPFDSLKANELYTVSTAHKQRALDESLYITEKIAHDVNIIRNPGSPNKAIILITPENPEKIDEIIYALYKNDLNFYRRQGLDITSVKIPDPAPAYSADKYIKTGEKIFFKELGYETTVLKGWYPPKISLDFKVYPDNYFDDKDRIKTHLRYVFPSVIHPDSVANIYLNNLFAKQVDIMAASESKTLNINASGLFSWDEVDRFPAYLIGKGFNQLRFELSLVPDKKGHCEVYNTENLVAMIMDNSYFILPEAKRWIELPHMEYVVNSTYPYSIYPDQQDTTLLITDRDHNTIAAAMNFIFFLTQEMHAYPYYLQVKHELSEEDKKRHIVAFGSIHNDQMQRLSQSAPVSFADTQMNKQYPFVKRFIEHLQITDEERLKKYRFISKMQESNQLDTALMMQMMRSPFENDKTLLMFNAENGRCLNDGVVSLFQYENRHLINGDMTLYDPIDETGLSYDIKPKYILTSMNWIDRLSLLISANPVKYMIILLIVLLIATWLLRKLLIAFKARRHSDVD